MKKTLKILSAFLFLFSCNRSPATSTPGGGQGSESAAFTITKTVDFSKHSKIQLNKKAVSVFSADHSLVALVEDANGANGWYSTKVEVYSTSDTLLKNSFLIPNMAVRQLRFLGDNETLIALGGQFGGNPNPPQIIKLLPNGTASQTNLPLAPPLSIHANIQAITVTPDGRSVAVAYFDPKKDLVEIYTFTPGATNARLVTFYQYTNSGISINDIYDLTVSHSGFSYLVVGGVYGGDSTAFILEHEKVYMSGTSLPVQVRFSNSLIQLGEDVNSFSFAKKPSAVFLNDKTALLNGVSTYLWDFSTASQTVDPLLGGGVTTSRSASLIDGSESAIFAVDKQVAIVNTTSPLVKLSSVVLDSRVIGVTAGQKRQTGVSIFMISADKRFITGNFDLPGL